MCEVSAEEHSINSVLPIKYGHSSFCLVIPAVNNYRNLKPRVVKELCDWADSAVFLRFYLLCLFGPLLGLLATRNEKEIAFSSHECFQNFKFSD